VIKLSLKLLIQFSNKTIFHHTRRERRVPLPALHGTAQHERRKDPAAMSTVVVYDVETPVDTPAQLQRFSIAHYNL
jgi:hypothetical protein